MKAQRKNPLPILHSDVPVTLPKLPKVKSICTLEQFKVLSDPLRNRILRLIQQEPRTAKQIAELLKSTHGSIGYHLHLMEKAELVQIVAHRKVRGIIANYYARTAKIFKFDLPKGLVEKGAVALDIINAARDEILDLQDQESGDKVYIAFPHARLSADRAKHYEQRLKKIVTDFLNEPQNPADKIYGMTVALLPPS